MQYVEGVSCRGRAGFELMFIDWKNPSPCPGLAGGRKMKLWCDQTASEAFWEEPPPGKCGKVFHNHFSGSFWPNTKQGGGDIPPPPTHNFACSLLSSSPKQSSARACALRWAGWTAPRAGIQGRRFNWRLMKGGDLRNSHSRTLKHKFCLRALPYA